ncbi:MAG: hypothetical protein H7840_18135 [Alphaproteobacteria bacterium]
MAGDVTVGMVYERDGAPHLRWVVEALTQVDGIPHVYMRSLGDRTDVRLLSAVALADRHAFHRVGTANSAPA